MLFDEIWTWEKKKICNLLSMSFWKPYNFWNKPNSTVLIQHSLLIDSWLSIIIFACLFAALEADFLQNDWKPCTILPQCTSENERTYSFQLISHVNISATSCVIFLGSLACSRYCNKDNHIHIQYKNLHHLCTVEN